MFSRYLVIVLALVAAGVQITRGAWVEAAGLISLAAGLVALKLSQTRPELRRVAYGGFVLTAVAIVVVFYRRDL